MNYFSVCEGELSKTKMPDFNKAGILYMKEVFKYQLLYIKYHQM